MSRKTELRVSYCLAHQDRPTTTRCSTCLKPICEECTLVTDQGNFCSTECHQKRLASNERVEMLAEEDARERIPRLVRRLVRFGFSLLMLVALFFAFKQLPVKWQAPVWKAWKQVKSAFH